MIAFMVINIIAFIIQGVGAVLLGIAMAIFVTFAAAIQEDCSYNAFTKQCVCISNGKKIYFYLFDFPLLHSQQLFKKIAHTMRYQTMFI